MTGASTTIGDDGRSPLHDRFPVGICHVCYQYIALFDAGHLRDIRNDLDGAGADTLSDGATLHPHHPPFFQVKTLHLGMVDAALNRLGSCLKDIKLAIFTIQSPLDIHRTAIVFFNGQCLACQRLDLFIGE